MNHFRVRATVTATLEKGDRIEGDRCSSVMATTVI